jgi:hypothetical protein
LGGKHRGSASDRFTEGSSIKCNAEQWGNMPTRIISSNDPSYGNAPSQACDTCPKFETAQHSDQNATSTTLPPDEPQKSMRHALAIISYSSAAGPSLCAQCVPLAASDLSLATPPPELSPATTPNPATFNKSGQTLFSIIVATAGYRGNCRYQNSSLHTCSAHSVLSSQVWCLTSGRG